MVFESMPPSLHEKLANFAFCHATRPPFTRTCQVNKLDRINLIQTFLYLVDINIFYNALWKFVRPVERKVFNINNMFRIKMWLRLILGLSHLLEQKFRHGFKDISNQFCSCSIEAENTVHYFVHCHFLDANQAILINVVMCGLVLLVATWNCNILQ